MLGDGLEVGSVFARIGALFDDDGFDKFRRAMRDVREDAGKEVKPDLEADFNARGFDQFDRALKGARADAVKDVEPDLGADFNGRGFQQFERALTGARADATRDVKTDLKADVDRRGFNEYDRALRSARNESDITTRAGVRAGNGFVSVGKSAAGAAVAFLGTYGLIEGVRKLYTAYRDSERVQQQTEAVLRSTGEEANVTGERVGFLADKYSQLAAVDDELIQEGENFLLTFTNIRNEVGKGNNIFDQATLTVLNMSVALGQDAKSSAIQLGKALNDPIKGITALSRVGVAFTEKTKERIETLVDEGKVLAAQKIILAELSKEFGGSAKAAGQGASGMDRLAIAAENLEEKIGGKLAPTISRWSSGAADFLRGVTEGDIRSSKFGRTLDNFYQRHKGTFQAIGRGAVQFGHTVADVFRVTVIGVRWFSGLFERSFDALATFLKGWAELFRGVMKVISSVLHGDLDGVVDGLKTTFSGLFGMVKGTLEQLTAPIRFAWEKVGGFIAQPVKRGVDIALGLLTTVLRKVADVAGISPDIPGVPDLQDFANEVNGAADGIDGYRESLRRASGEQKNAAREARRHVDVLKAERAVLKLNDASHDELRRNKQKLRKAQDELDDSNRDTGRGYGILTKALRNGWLPELKKAEDGQRRTRKSTRDLHATVRDQAPVNSFAKGLRRLIRGSGNFQGALGRAVDFVKSATNKALSGFGAKPMTWVVEAAKDVGDLLGFARGGFIGRRGQKGKDKRLVLAGDGEAFFNGDQVPYVEQALRKTYGVSLGQFFGGRRWRPHSQTTGFEHGGVVDAFASGGFVDPAGPGTGVVNPAIAPVVGQWSQRYNAAINYGYDPGGGHQSAGHNVTGTATDAGPAAGWTTSATALFEQGLRAIEGKVDQILYGTAGIGESYPNHGRGNHAHIEWGLNPRGIGASHIPKLTIQGPAGPQRTILQNAADLMVKRANAHLDKQASPVGMIAGDIGPGTLTEEEFLSIAREALDITGHGKLSGGARKLLILAEQESGLDPNSINNWDSNAAAGNPSGGLMHTTESTFEAYHEPGTANTYFDPLASVAASINYQFDRYGGLVTHSPYEEGGIVEAFAGGGQVGAKGGGAKDKPKKAPKVSVGIAEPAGPNIHVAEMGPLEAHLGKSGGKFVARAEGRVADLEADYGYWERRFNLSEEEFIVEGDSGEPVLNRPAIKRRVEELQKLLAIRKAIIAVRNREIAFAKKTIELLRPVLKSLKQGLRGARSKSAREKWRAALEQYTGQLTNWKGQLGGWQSDRRERFLDRDEVVQQLEALKAGGSLEGEFNDQLADFGAGGEEGDGGEGAGGEVGSGEGGEAAPTPEQIAAAAGAQLAEFQAQRSSLYGEFGGNFVPAGTVPFATEQQQAAGMAFYGVAGAQAQSIPALVRGAVEQGGAGGVQISLEQNFDAPPPDPHTWTQSALFELGAQL